MSTGAAAPSPADAAAQSAPAVAAPAGPAGPRCDNCGASVPGRYCGSCGQRLEPPVHSLWHFLRIATEDVTHADSRLWRTLYALMLRPGFLTCEFLAGRRAAYLPPVRLYLVLSVVFFLWASATEQLQVEGPGQAAAQTAEQAAGACRNVRNVPWKAVQQPLYAACVQSATNGRSLSAAILARTPHAMFLFLPLFGALMMLCYRHPRRYYVEHLLFLVHNHAFAFVLLMLAWAAASVLPFAATPVGWAAALYIGWYLYRSMRVAYGQGRARTLGKLLVLSFFYLIGGALTLALVSVYSALTL